MKKISVVIGTNYGDEGKGLTTDWLASQDPVRSLVVRFSGGANAGHTVELEDGTRHVFHHFGSGTLRGVPTLLTRDFVVNPILFWQELDQIASINKTLDPIVIVDERCKITTPYDVFLNQLIERKRNDSRHGSTGVGLNETIDRSEEVDFTIGDLNAANTTFVLNMRLKQVKEYFYNKLKELGFENEDLSILKTADERFKEDIIDFMQYVGVHTDTLFMELADHIIFEGSQGLMLDQNSDDFPHVTRANTGLTNLKNYGDILNTDINIYYITRSYLTRHGAGSMPTEDELLSELYTDQTNVHNEFQGTLRYGHLDFERIKSVVEKDLLNITDKSKVTVNAVMSWFDVSKVDEIEKFSDAINADNKIVVFGKTAEDFVLLKD